MTDDILDIAKWKNNYPFLKNVSDIYDKYNSNEYDNEYKNTYDGLCYTIIDKVVYGDAKKHKDICMKLMRNLKYFSLNSKDYKISNERCNILFHWLYGFLKEDKITYDIIDKCFENYDDYSSIKKNTKMKCLYFKDDKFIEPTKITLLDIFNDNIDIIKDTLKDVNVSISNLARKYVCECVKIYKYMNDKYCDNGEGKNKNYKSTCLKLNQFKSIYNIFHSNLGELNTSVASVDDLDNEFSVKCPSAQPNMALTPEKAKNREATLGMGTIPAAGDYDAPLVEELRAPPEIVDSSMKKNITTTIGTLAGASSVLALLYRFTPAGRFVNPRLRRMGGRTNNNFYSDRESELLFDEFAQGNINTYNIGYDAA
ncbi:unnamed protein product [Plasmodium vivax]|uniref:(malaria parasite P. vivax) hypothetical protein n=1 Tax=Plasmodium vivax TaxID=5855 RepID=A0A8S4H5V1_PLAVI|nr:unnamed protein product [Plasmodium vivax]